jgi:hypothetical protein
LVLLSSSMVNPSSSSIRDRLQLLPWIPWHYTSFPRHHQSVRLHWDWPDPPLHSGPSPLSRTNFITKFDASPSSLSSLVIASSLFGLNQYFVLVLSFIFHSSWLKHHQFFPTTGQFRWGDIDNIHRFHLAQINFNRWLTNWILLVYILMCFTVSFYPQKAFGKLWSTVSFAPICTSSN